MRKLLPLLVLMLALGLAGCTEKIAIGEEHYPVDTTALDLREKLPDDLSVLQSFPELRQVDVRETGITGAQYDRLQQLLPGCQILWTPMFQGESYDIATQAFAVKTISEEDLADLARFPELKTINATMCRDNEALASLISRFPELEVEYLVSLGSCVLSPDQTEATVRDAAGEDLELGLSLLPGLNKLTFTGKLPEMTQIQSLQETHPQLELHWEVSLCGKTYTEDTTMLDLSGIPMDSVEEVEAAVPYLPALEKVEMCGCGIPNEEMDALNRRYDNIHFIWTVDLGPYITVRTDLTKFIIYKYRYKYSLDDAAAYNMRYLTEMVCLDLGHNELTNCDFVAYMPHLKYLVIADTAISDLTPLTGLSELVYLELFLCPVEDYSPLATLTALEDLNIGYTDGTDPAPLMQMTWLKKLWWSKCPLKSEGREQLRQALPNTEIVTNQPSSTGGGWRNTQNYYDMRDMLEMHYMTG